MADQNSSGEGVRLCEQKVCIRDTPCEECSCAPEKDLPALVFRLRHERNFWSWKHSLRETELDELEEAEGDTPGPLEEAYGRDVVAQDRLTSLQAGLKAEVERLRRIQMHEEGMRGQWEREAPLQDDQAWAAQQVAGASKEAADRLENLLRESEGSDDGA